MQATGHPIFMPSMLQHQLHVLLDEALSLDGLFSAAAAGGPTAPANEWLRRQLGSQLTQHAAAFARSVALQYPQLDSAAQQVQDVLTASGSLLLFQHPLYIITSCAA